MSLRRFSASQIIEKGDYLDPGFDARSLTISQLLGVLGFHDISYPSPYSKPKLVDVFNSEIRSKASILQKQSILRANGRARVNAKDGREPVQTSLRGSSPRLRAGEKGTVPVCLLFPPAFSVEVQYNN
ncbi:hypothetical protein B0H11DRAFT_1931210 [Mycena galericulata]|nr:hypothetical protein B0H11DRAFT_1931210 [Mycena galericulata]